MFCFSWDVWTKIHSLQIGYLWQAKEMIPPPVAWRTNEFVEITERSMVDELLMWLWLSSVTSGTPHFLSYSPTTFINCVVLFSSVIIWLALLSSFSFAYLFFHLNSILFKGKDPRKCTSLCLHHYFPQYRRLIFIHLFIHQLII